MGFVTLKVAGAVLAGCRPNLRAVLAGQGFENIGGGKSKFGGDYQIRHAPRRQVVNSELQRRWGVVSSQVE